MINHTPLKDKTRLNTATSQRPWGESVSTPAFKHAQRVQLASATKGNDQKEAADEAADDGGSDDSGRNNNGTALLVAAVAAVILRITHPGLEHTAVILQEVRHI